MWNYEKRAPVSCKYYPAQSPNWRRSSSANTAAPTGKWGLPCGTSPSGSRARQPGHHGHPQRCGYGRTGSLGNGGHHSASAHLRPVHGGKSKNPLCQLLCGPHRRHLAPGPPEASPFNACEFQSKGDPLTDLFEDLAAEQKARSTYDNILRLVKDPEVADPIRFLRAREIVHFQRFGEAIRSVQDQLDSKNFYAFNPSFDVPASLPLLRQLMILLPSSPGLTLWGQPGSFIFRPVTPKRAESSSTP